jgi:hypothetical protein
MTKSEFTARQQVDATVAAGTPVVYIVTWEEERLEQMLASASRDLFGDDREVWQWTEALGFINGPGQDQTSEILLTHLHLLPVAIQRQFF